VRLHDQAEGGGEGPARDLGEDREEEANDGDGYPDFVEDRDEQADGDGSTLNLGSALDLDEDREEEADDGGAGAEESDPDRGEEMEAQEEDQGGVRDDA